MSDPFADPAQMATLRKLLAVPPDAPDPDGEDVLAVLEAQALVNAASQRWLDLDPQEES